MSSLYKARVRTNPDPVSSFDLFDAQITIGGKTYFGYGESPDDALVDLQGAVINGQTLTTHVDDRLAPDGRTVHFHTAEYPYVELDVELGDGLDAPLSNYGGLDGYVAPEEYLGETPDIAVMHTSVSPPAGTFHLGNFVQQEVFDRAVDGWRNLADEQDKKIVELENQIKEQVKTQRLWLRDSHLYRTGFYGERVGRQKAERIAEAALELAHKHYVTALPLRLLGESLTDAGTALFEALRG